MGGELTLKTKYKRYAFKKKFYQELNHGVGHFGS